MGRQTVRFDDSEKRHKGRIVEAQHFDVPLSFNGRSAKLDLSEENFKLLTELSNPWFDAVADDQPKARGPEWGEGASPVVAVPNPQVTPEGSRGNPYAMTARTGQHVEWPGIQTFAKSVGVTYHPRNMPKELLELYKEARDSGEFVPDIKQYPPRLNGTIVHA